MAKEKGKHMSKWTQALAEQGIDCSNWKHKGFERVPADVWEDLLYEINKAGIHPADNYRAYRFKDGLHIAAYKKATAKGCCGEAQWWTKSRSGDIWRIGCNYGH